MNIHFEEKDLQKFIDLNKRLEVVGKELNDIAAQANGFIPGSYNYMLSDKFTLNSKDFIDLRNEILVQIGSLTIQIESRAHHG